MSNFAVLDGELVINVVIADSKEIAEEVTGMTCVEFTTENAEPGGTYSNGVFIKRKPYPSWILDENNDWQAPVAIPVEEGVHVEYQWNEGILGWTMVASE